VSFQRRLLIGFASLLVLAMLVAGAAVSVTSSARIERATLTRLDVGAAVLEGFLEGRLSQLASSVRVLTSDFGFRAAVASEDAATLGSVLANHGQRIEADLLALTALDGALLASTDPHLVQGAKLPFDGLIAEAESRDEVTSTLVWQDVAYQIIVRSVRAPDPIAYVVMGFALDETVARELSELAQLDVSFLTLRDSEPQVTATTHTATNLRAAFDHIDLKLPATQTGVWRNDQYLGTLRSLGAPIDPARALPGSLSPMALLQAATLEIKETQRLVLTQLAFILLVTLMLSLGVSYWLARRMGDPVAQLVDGSRRIRSGDYSEPIVLEQAGELSVLGDAMNVMAQDIAEREENIRRQAYVESTTGMPNKLALGEHLAVLTASREPFVLCLFALVNSREINLNLGYEASERVLQVAAQRLASAVRGDDCLYALRADEYALVLTNMTLDAALPRAASLADTLADNYQVDRWSVSGRSSAGLIAYPDHAQDAESLLRGLGTTLDEAIENDERVRCYVPGQEDSHARQLQIISELDRSFAKDEFQLWFQPKIDIATGRVFECEALIRWIHPELGFIPPGKFVELAERAGKISQLTDFVLDRGIACAAGWQNHFPMRVAMNLSALDLAQPDLASRVAATMGRYGAAGEWLALEVTESAVLRDADQACQMLEQLRELGIRLSVDDYGTGYSSLSQLKKLPVDELKIDMSFIRELDTSPHDAVIVQSTIELGHNLGLTVVAEGVENRPSLDLLSGWGCNKAQGYYFSKPLAEAAFLEWVTQFNTTTRETADALS
jgi:diguanylate cyclase (GGDEF)-like protein